MHAHVSRDVATLLQSLRVLVVEDNSFTRKVNRGLLAHLGVRTIHEAPDAIAGLEAIRTCAPDLVIVDWNLPMVSGAELVRWCARHAPSQCPTCRSSSSPVTANAGA
jgi:two-component system, chemotaxis family, chemotaxis protein CheY